MGGNAKTMLISPIFFSIVCIDYREAGRQKEYQSMINIAVDAMGGDYAPGEIIKGAVQAAGMRDDIRIILVGQEETVKEELKKYTFRDGQITVQNAAEVIATEEPPVNAIRKKKDSSLVVGMNMVKKGEADAIVSAGSSGAILVGGQVIVGRIRGVERPPLAPLIPTEKGVSLLIDCGANVDARPSHLVQFARMGSIYMDPIFAKRCILAQRIICFYRRNTIFFTQRHRHFHGKDICFRQSASGLLVHPSESISADFPMPEEKCADGFLYKKFRS